MSKAATPSSVEDNTPPPTTTTTPSLKQKVVDLIITPCLVEGEPYAERSRKIAVACLSVMASNAMLVGIPLTLIAALYDPDVGLFITGLTCITCSLTSSFIPYMYLRRTRTMPQWMVDFQLWTTLPSLVSFMLFMHQGPVTIVCSTVALVAILLRVRLWYLYLAITVLGNAFNHIVAGFKEELPELHEAMFREQFLFERIFLMIGAAALPVTMLGLALHGLITDFVERADQSDAAITMFLSVAKKLVVYNTDGVAEILAANKGKVDENLLEAFTAIQHNLQEYRPHIPDYVIAAATDRLAGSSALGDSVVENGDSSVLRLSGVDEFSEGSISDRPGRMASSTATSETPSSNRRAPSSRAASSHNYEVNHATPKKDAAGGDTLAAHFYGRATTVFVRFVGAKLEMATGTAADRQCSALILNTCVELASKHAKLHGGALQYMQGCGLMVSFNAASRVMSHERNACMFAVRLREEIEGLGTAVGVSVHASIVTSPVLSFFAGNRGQLMLTVLGTFMSQHTAIQQYGRMLLGGSDAAKSTSMLLMSASTMHGLAMCVTYRMVGDIRCDGSSSVHQTVQVFQVMSLVRKASTAEEWMYDLRENVNSESTELEEAIRLALADDCSTALNVIRTSTVQDSVVEYITKRLEACMGTSSKFAVSIDTLQMW